MNERLNKIFYELLSRRLVYSQADLARQIGKSKPTTNQMLSGKAKITPKTLEAICAAFPMINKTWLLTGEGSMMLDQPQTPTISIENVGNPTIKVETDKQSTKEQTPSAETNARIAALEAENKALKEQIEWLRSVINK